MWYLFGWGGVAIPFILGTAGFYLVLLGMEQPPEVNWYRIGGLGLCFLAFEAIATIFVQAAENGMSDPWMIAQQQIGGGYVGGALSKLTTALVGDIGGAFLYFLVAIVGVLLMSGISRAEMGEWLRSLGEKSAELPQKARDRNALDNGIPDNPAPATDIPALIL